MIKITIKNNQNEVVGKTIMKEEDVSAFLSQIASQATFGKPEHYNVVIPAHLVPESGERVEATLELIASEYSVEQEDVSSELEQRQINAEALQYLSSTDWLIVRELETSVSCPEEIKIARAEARARIVR